VVDDHPSVVPAMGSRPRDQFRSPEAVVSLGLIRDQTWPRVGRVRRPPSRGPRTSSSCAGDVALTSKPVGRARLSCQVREVGGLAPLIAGAMVTCSWRLRPEGSISSTGVVGTVAGRGDEEDFSSGAAFIRVSMASVWSLKSSRRAPPVLRVSCYGPSFLKSLLRVLCGAAPGMLQHAGAGLAQV